MRAVLPSGNRYRHVVFAPPARRPPLNLGAPGPRPPAPARPAPGNAAPNTDDFTFLTWLFAEAGLGARHYRAAALRRRLPACLRALRAPNVAHARRLLRHQPRLIRVAIDALLLGVTEFFRDEPVYACLARELPAMLERTTHVRVWSAACSEGAELYSVAMLLTEIESLDRCELLGTDCRAGAIATASAGSYGAVALRGLSVQRLARFFESRADDSPRPISAALRGSTTWRQADVLDAVQPGPWHLVLCRNMAMYLEPDAAERLWRRLAAELAPGGLLVVGKAERPHGAAGITPVGPCVYRRWGGDP
jgi:chemotaxis methyl-accepting protein methylase